MAIQSFFEYDEGERRGHSKNCLKRGPDWMLQIFHSASGTLTETCVNCKTVNNFKDYILKELEPETCTFEYYNV